MVQSFQYVLLGPNHLLKRSGSPEKVFFYIELISHVVMGKGGCSKLSMQITYKTLERSCAKSVIYFTLGSKYTVSEHQSHTPSREERHFLYFNHLSKEFLVQMIPHLKALI